MELTKRDRWEIWVQDLEEKLAYHLWQLKEQKKLSEHKPVIEVRESENMKGVYEVWESGRKRFIYDGPLAHYRATKKAGELLEELQSEDMSKKR